MSNQIVCVVQARWKGTTLPLKKGAKFMPGGVKNNPMIFGKQTFRSQEGVSSSLTGSIPFRRGDSLFAIIGDMSEGELQVICDTGQTFVVTDAFLHDPPGWTGGEGERSLEWSGSEAEEIA